MTDKLHSILLEMEKEVAIKNDEDLKEALNRIVEDEKKKPAEKYDHEIFIECVNMILEIDGVNLSVVEKKNQERLRKILEDIRKSEIEQAKPLKRKILKPALITCIIILSSLLVLTVVAYATGYNSFIEMGKALFNFPEKTLIDMGNGWEIIYSSDTRTYNSVEEMTKSENIEIVYPRVLPEGYTFEKVKVIDCGDYWEIFITSNENYIAVNISTNYKNNSLSEYTNEINGIKYLVTEIDGLYYAMYVVDNNHYSLTCKYNEDLLEMLQNIK